MAIHRTLQLTLTVLTPPALVRNALAVAYTQYSKDHLQTEACARATKLGIWNVPPQMPWDDRKTTHPQPVQQ